MTTCFDQDAIDSYFDDLQLDITYVNTKFEVDNYDNTIRYYLEKLIVDLDSKNEQKLQMSIQKQITSLYNDLFKFWESAKGIYFQVTDIRQTSDKLSTKTNALATVNLKLDKYQTTYFRKAQTVFVLLEEIGGFQESMHIIGFFFVVFFQKKLFEGAFLRQLYSIRPEPKKLDPKRKVQDIPLKDEEADEQVVRSISNSVSLKLEDLNATFTSIVNRSRFRYKFKEVIDYMVNCICIRRMKKLKTSRHKKHFLFLKGVEKIEQELDVVNLIRQIRKLKLMTKILFNSRQNTLLKFQRKNLIEATTSSSDSDHHKYDTIKLMTSNRPLLQLS